MSFDNLPSAQDAVHSAVTFGSITDMARQNAAAADIADHTELLDEVHERIEFSNNQGGMSQEALAFAMLTVQHTTTSLGINSNLLRFPAQESFVDGLAVVDTRTLELATEGLGASVGDIARRQYSSLLRSWRFLGTQLTFQRRSLKQLLESAKTVKGKQDVTPIEVDFDRLQQDGKVPASPVTFLTGYYQSFGQLQKKWFSVAGPCWNENFQLVGKLKRDTGKNFEQSLGQIADGFADCRKRAGLNPDMQVPGGYRFFIDRKLGYTGDIAAAKKLDALANKGYPRRMGDMRRIGEVGKVKVKPLTKEEVQKLCKTALDAMSPMSEVDAFLESLQSQATSIFSGPLWLVPFLKRSSWASPWVTPASRRWSMA